MKFLLVALLFTFQHAKAIELKVKVKEVPNFSQTGSVQIGKQGASLNHGCEWFHFADLTTFTGTAPVTIAAKIRSSSGQAGFYFGLDHEGYVTLRLLKQSTGATNTVIQLVKYFKNGSSKTLAGKLFSHNNDQWIDGLLEFEFSALDSKIYKLKFNGVDYTSEFQIANSYLKPGSLNGQFGSFCFMGYSNLTNMTINGQPVRFQ